MKIGKKKVIYRKTISGGLKWIKLVQKMGIIHVLPPMAIIKMSCFSYNTLGDYLKRYNSEWELHMYPQGSFELGTVIKPLNEDEQYNVDLVVLIKKPNFDPYKKGQGYVYRQAF